MILYSILPPPHCCWPRGITHHLCTSCTKPAAFPCCGPAQPQPSKQHCWGAPIHLTVGKLSPAVWRGRSGAGCEALSPCLSPMSSPQG